MYDTLNDRTELKNLAAAQPGRVKALSATWDQYAARANVLPLGGWKAPERGKKGKAARLSTKTRFELKKGESLERTEAPAVANRAFTITAKFNADARSGVLVAQGGIAASRRRA